MGAREIRLMGGGANSFNGDRQRRDQQETTTLVHESINLEPDHVDDAKPGIHHPHPVQRMRTFVVAAVLTLFTSSLVSSRRNSREMNMCIFLWPFLFFSFPLLGNRWFFAIQPRAWGPFLWWGIGFLGFGWFCVWLLSPLAALPSPPLSLLILLSSQACE